MFSKTKTKNPRSLSYRLASRFTALLILSHIILIVGLYLIIDRGVHAKDQKLARSRFEEVETLIEKNDPAKLQSKLNLQDDLLVRIFNPDGEMIYGRLPRALKNFDLIDIENGIAEAMQTFGPRTIKPKIIGEETIEIFSGKVGDGTLVVGINTDDSEDFLHLFISAAIIGIVITSLLSLLLGYIYAKQALLPVRALIQTIHDIRAGRAQPAPSSGNENDELTELTNLFNSMIAQINQLIASLKQSLDSIAHELRTPITHLINRYEHFLSSSQPTASREYIHECLEETQRISSLVTTLLELTEAKSGNFQIIKKEFQLKPLLLECAELYEYVAEEKGGHIEIQCPEITVFADRNRLKRVIANLLDNSLKYSDKNVQIKISGTKQNGAVLLCVEDTGWGIPIADQSKIWQRLYRGDKSRTSQGMGLGLSFVKSILDLHGSEITMTSEEQKGTVFTITIPSNSDT